MTDSIEEYNIATIRDLLHTAFTAKTLPRFCRNDPRFRPLCDEFSPSDGLADMVERVIAYGETYDLLGELLAEVERANPKQYANFAAELGGAVRVAYEPPPLPGPDELPARGPRLRGWRLPHGENWLFTGREGALKRLAGALLHGERRAAVVRGTQVEWQQR